MNQCLAVIPFLLRIMIRHDVAIQVQLFGNFSYGSLDLRDI